MSIGTQLVEVVEYEIDDTLDSEILVLCEEYGV